MWFSTLWFSVYLCLRGSDEYDQRQDFISIVANMLQNLSHMYYSHNSNIKFVNSSIKCVGFESIHYAINPDDDVSSFLVFNDFDYIFISMYC